MKLKELYWRLPKYIRNRYTALFLIFMTWMLFFDGNNIWSQIKLRIEVSNLRKQKIELRKQINEVSKEKEELLNDPKKIEKFAREKYWMKKDREDVFILVEDTFKR